MLLFIYSFKKYEVVTNQREASSSDASILT